MEGCLIAKRKNPLATRVSKKIYTAADKRVGFLKRFEVNFIKKMFTLIDYIALKADNY